jgi:hypothetical protein
MCNLWKNEHLSAQEYAVWIEAITCQILALEPHPVSSGMQPQDAKPEAKS